jgi:putative adhesin
MLRTALVTLIAATALVGPGSAQSRGRDTARSGGLSCTDRYDDRDRATHCEMREETIGGANPLDIDAGRNGGIRVRGWDRGDVLVRARIEARADTDADARRLVAGVRIDTAGGRVRADGPDTSGRDESWNVGFEINVPRNAMLTLNTNNGGIAIDDFRGTATFHARNGGLALRNVGGDLRGDTTNGGVTLDVSGDHWDGSGLDVETRNGGINLNLPKGFSAELEAGTTHGRVSIDFPVTVQGSIGRHLETTLGSGGPKLRAITTNGGVTIRQR